MLHPQTETGRSGVRLVVRGLVVAAVMVTVIATTGWHASVGPLSIFGLISLLGLAAAACGGLIAAVAVVRNGERSAVALVAVTLAVLALLVVISEVAFDVP